MSTATVILIVFFLSAIVLIVAIAFLSYKTAHPERSSWIETGIDSVKSIDDTDLPYEDIIFIGHENTKITGQIVRNPNSELCQGEKTFILIHGHKKNKSQMLGRGTLLFDMGYNLVFIDFRHHGDSEDGPFGLGYFGRLDLKNIIEHVQSTVFPESKIGVFGISLGATTALATFGEWQNLDCLICDSPSSNQTTTLCEYAHRLYFAPHWITKFSLTLAEKYYGMEFSALDIPSLIRKQQAAWQKLPLLILHGDADNRVPLYHAEDIVRTIRTGREGSSEQSAKDSGKTGAVEKQSLVVFQNANHVQGYAKERRRYEQSVRDFLNNWFH